MKADKALSRHPRESGNPELIGRWTPAFAGVTNQLTNLALLTLLTFFNPRSAEAVALDEIQVTPKKGIRIGTIDLERVFRQYPETKKAKEDLEKLILIKENEIAAKRGEIFRLMEDIEKLKQNQPAALGERGTLGAGGVEPPLSATPIPALTPETTAMMELPGLMETQEAPPGGVKQEPPASPEPAAAPGASAPAGAGGAAPALISPEVEEKEKQLKILQEELSRLERSAEINLQKLEEAKTKTLLAKIYLSLQELSREQSVDMIVDKNSILWGAPSLDLTDELLKKLKYKTIERE